MSKKKTIKKTKTTPLEDLGFLLKKLRKDANLSQEAVSTMFGYTTPQFVSNWERGLISPPIDTMKSLETIYQVPKGAITKNYVMMVEQKIKETPPKPFQELQ